MSRHVDNTAGGATPIRHHGGMVLVALYAGGKSLLVLGLGLLFAILLARGQSAHDMADKLVDILPVNEDGHAVQWFLKWSESVSPGGWLAFFGFVLVYATLHGVQAVGLWHEKRWAEWLTAVSAGIYLPIEGYEIAHHPGLVLCCVMAGNLCVVGYMAWVLWKGKKKGHPSR